MQVVRNSKFRHVFGTGYKQEMSYQGLKVKTTANDSDWIKANSKFFAVSWQAGGGAIVVMNHEDVGKHTAGNMPLITGHKATVVDFDFNPFNDYVIATASEDQTSRIWAIPEGGVKETIDTPLVELEGHDRKLTHCKFHPLASNVLFTAAADNLLKVWDIENGAEKLSIDVHKNAIQSFDFNVDGSQMVTHSKDKKLRLLDPRSNSVANEADGHAGVKGARVQWLNNLDMIHTVGFSKMAERQHRLYDPRNLSEPLFSENIDVASGLLMSFFDEDSGLMFLAGKGDANIRYYEIDDKKPYMHFVSQYSSSKPQKGMTMMPKYTVDVNQCEIVRMLKLESDAVQPISFTVPRKATDVFQKDLYPDTVAPEPVLTAEEWFNGKNAEPKTMSMKPGENNLSSAPKPSDFKPKVTYKPKEKVPPKTTDPKKLLAQNEELREIITKLEKENADLRAKAGQ
eukprot:gb/GECH01008527.1/.p1 GENE.gb/GECH01008527.1/~~gb/GECH01008527.1/.p1  ORF type:complete len:455 (+),score=92.75 gb/GECH01008527.1/:1-1365(+)